MVISSRKPVKIGGSVEWWEWVRAWRMYEGLHWSESMWLVQ